MNSTAFAFLGLAMGRLRAMVVSFGLLTLVASGQSIHAPSGPHLPLEVDSLRVARTERVVDLNLNFEDLGAERFAESILLGQMQLMEVDPAGYILEEHVPYQWDVAPGSAATVGSLSFLLRGDTAAGAIRFYRLYFNRDNASLNDWNPRHGVRLERIGVYEGEDAWKFTTPNATYFYHHQSGGFASMVDREGKDWISYHPGNKEKGEYRGIPNIAPPDFHPGRPAGKKPGRVLAEGPLRVRVRAETEDGLWAKDWDIFPTHARMTLFRKGPQPYWVLYEGTPGGEFTEDDYFVDSSGKRYRSQDHPQAKPWHGDLPPPEWVYFGDPALRRVLYLARHEYSDVIDEYWHFGNGGMTVFGFGRGPRAEGWQRLTQVPSRLTIGFVESDEHATARSAIEAAWRDVRISAGRVTWSTGSGGR
ncbi:MAG: hypothetical protein MUF01_18155 [Bryobacterales bacterium]|nr:hypothetical protein [Bryobacterales bacterium]